MTTRSIEQLAAAVEPWRGTSVAVTELHGGITNRNYLAAVEGRRFVLRIPGERTELLGIDRSNEAEAARRAAELGIGPAVVGELPDIGTLITEFVDGHHLAGNDFVSRLTDVATIVRRLHDSGPVRGSFPIHEVVQWHARDAAMHGVQPPPVYAELLDASQQIRAAWRSSAADVVPCHNDLLPANVLFTSDRVWLLDFEYAGMNDRSFDLGNLSINAGLSDEAEETLLAAYFGEVTRQALARLRLMKVMSEFREGMWAVVQQAISTLDTDFVGYATERLESCRAMTASEAFRGWLRDAG